MKRLKAFTLAEVLITLGIIGVVAAISMPTLIQNYQKKSYVEGLKVGISVLEQAFKKAMADDEVTDFRDTELFKGCHDFERPDFSITTCQLIMGKYIKNLKIESVEDMLALGDSTNTISDVTKCNQLVGKTNKWWYLNDKTKCKGWKNLAVTFANGIRADIAFLDMGYSAGAVTALDVNGSKGPNTWGRDAFYLVILNNGHVTTYPAIDHIKAKAKYENKDFDALWQANSWEINNLCSKTTTADGADCGARIIESGWKMDY